MNGETFILSGKNRFGKDCFYPSNGRKDYFASEVEKMGTDQPSEKFFEVGDKIYKILYAMH